MTAAASGSGSSIGYISSAVAPGFTVSGDSNTGFYSGARDTIGLTIGGVDAFYGEEVAGVNYMYFRGGTISCPGTQTGSEQWGDYARAIGVYSTSLGAYSDATGSNAFAAGFGSQAVAAGTTSIGTSTTATAIDGTSAGFHADATALGATALGARSGSSHDYAITLGVDCVSEDENALHLGARLVDAAGVHRIYLGHGNTSAFAGVTASRIWATSGNGTDIGGTDLQLAGGSPTGSGAGGEVRILTAPAGASGTTLRTLQYRITVREDGDIDCHDNAITFGDATCTGDMIVPSPTVPGSASATGTAGMISWDASYVYICTATNTWKRVAIATW